MKIENFVSVKVKWGRENFPNIEVNTDEDPILFKAQLYALTGETLFFSVPLWFRRDSVRVHCTIV